MPDFPIRSRLIAAALLFAASAAHATNYTVGADAACGYTTIAAAITAAAAQTSGSRPKIYVAKNKAYTAQALSFNGFSFSLIGGVPDCAHLTSSGNTTISGTGSASVIAITDTNTGHQAILSHLTISGGGGGSGGGVYYAGASTLDIDNASIINNHADNGGGIRFVASGGAATLNLQTNTFVTNNVANNTGGGIRADGAASVHVDEDQTWIARNEAGDYGGGIAAVGGANVHIGSPGYRITQYIGVIHSNAAANGGGIAVIAESTGTASVEIFPTDPAHPVRIEQNRATGKGGGIYAIPYDHSVPIVFAPAIVHLGGAQIDDNAAPDGSALYANIDGRAADLTVYANHCAAGVECTTMSYNRNVDAADHPVAGATLVIEDDSYAQIHGLVMRGNQGTSLIRLVDGLLEPFVLDGCLLADNVVTSQLATFGSAATTIDQCTIAGNAIGGSTVLRAQSGFAMTRSIVAQGALPVLQLSGGSTGASFDYLLVPAGAPDPAQGAQHVTRGDPRFIDAVNGDYHLDAHSPAIDVAPATVDDDHDIENRPRDLDLPTTPNIDGVRDLGAYERQIAGCYTSDTVYCDGFDP